MRSFSRLTVMGLVISVFLILAPLAQADTQRARSAPNGDIATTSSSGALSNRDKDQDFNTLTQADKGSLFYSVFNQADFGQTVHVSVVLDGPGTAQDATLVDEDVALGPSCPQDGSLCTDGEQGRFEFKVRQKDWPAGTYSLSVTGSASETATAVSTFTVAYK
ncbi:MAG: hypothetical protein GEU68_15265 [Actinobacteria bacterium]|nr:hypothetical protein [Actinomycetota bacterium]